MKKILLVICIFTMLLTGCGNSTTSEKKNTSESIAKAVCDARLGNLSYEEYIALYIPDAQDYIRNELTKDDFEELLSDDAISDCTYVYKSASPEEEVQWINEDFSEEMEVSVNFSECEIYEATVDGSYSDIYVCKYEDKWYLGYFD
ncbi:MAG: hypothetical protein Q4G04_02475 [bacterium]|nr:hypothetical protein [bacterium]